MAVLIEVWEWRHLRVLRMHQDFFILFEHDRKVAVETSQREIVRAFRERATTVK